MSVPERRSSDGSLTFISYRTVGEETEARRARGPLRETLVRSSLSLQLLLTVWHSKTQAQLPNALGLASSSTLGTGRAITHQKRLEQAEHNEVKRNMDGRAVTGKRKRTAKVRELSPDTSGDSDAFLDAETAESHLRESPDDIAGSSASHPVVIIDEAADSRPNPASHQAEPIVVGGALKRKADGTVEQPRVTKQRKKSLVTLVLSLPQLWY